MLGFSFFGSGRKNRKFEYKPRHYDPDQEEREARRRKIVGDDYREGEYRPGMLIREKRLLRMQESDQNRRNRNRTTMIRSAIFLVFVLGILYFMFSYFGQAFSFLDR